MCLARGGTVCTDVSLVARGLECQAEPTLRGGCLGVGGMAPKVLGTSNSPSCWREAARDPAVPRVPWAVGPPSSRGETEPRPELRLGRGGLGHRWASELCTQGRPFPAAASVRTWPLGLWPRFLDPLGVASFEAALVLAGGRGVHCAPCHTQTLRTSRAEGPLPAPA